MLGRAGAQAPTLFTRVADFLVGLKPAPAYAVFFALLSGIGMFSLLHGSLAAFFNLGIATLVADLVVFMFFAALGGGVLLIISTFLRSALFAVLGWTRYATISHSLTLLRESPTACESALRLIAESSRARNYRDQVLAQSRALRNIDWAFFATCMHRMSRAGKSLPTMQLVVRFMGLRTSI